MIEIKRFEDKPYQKNKKFYKKIFVQSEINYCLKFKNPGPHFAGKFAIKEAMKKLLDESIDFFRYYKLNIKNSKTYCEFKN